MARLPATAGLRTVMLSLALGFSGLAAWENALAWNGPVQDSRPSVPRCAERLMAPPAEAKRRVLVMGSSRVQAGVRAEWVEAALGPRVEVRNLGLVRGSGPLELHISMEQLIEGDVVVVEMLPVGAWQDQESADLAELRGMLKDAQGVGVLDAKAKQLLRKALPGTNSGTSPSNELRLFVRGKFSIEDPNEGLWVFFPDGWQQATEGGGLRVAQDAACARVTEVEAGAKRAQMRDAVLERLRREVHELEGRGVAVYFIQPPVGGKTRESEERLFPRAKFWDRLSHAFPGQCWHYADFAETATLATCDGSHLTRDSAQVYSRWLGAIVAAEYATHE